jgi:cyclopropane fatty-acyl-phospholipid synthase-like methyltransferase
VNTVIDFGCGIGSLGIVLSQLGFEVILADIAKPLLKYAQWRLDKRGLPAKSLDLGLTSPTSTSAHLVCALDTLEHVGNPQEALTHIYEWLAPRGWVMFNLFSEEALASDDEHPMHVTSGRRILPLMRSIGFSSPQIFQRLMVYRKPRKRILPTSIAGFCSRFFWSIRWRVKNLIR